MRRARKLKGKAKGLNHLNQVGERDIVRWEHCEPKNRAWQEKRVRELGHCPYCENLDENILIGYSSSSSSRGWPEPRVSMMQAAKEGCKSCSLLCRVIKDFKLASNFEDKTVALRVSASVDPLRFDVLVRMNDKKSQSVRISRLYEVQEPTWTALPLVNRIIPDYLGDQSCLDLVGLWLQECLDTHEVGPRPVPQLPTRVIEIVDGHVVKLVHTDGQRGQYLTLSHHWSSDPLLRPKKTTRDNIQCHMEGLPTSSLPKTFRDAIALTCRLGYRYLWVDSLCIIQDDRNDWARESAKMSEVYGSSILTIFAATHWGCFVRRCSETIRFGNDWLDFQTRNYRYRTNSGKDLEVIAQSQLRHSRVEREYTSSNVEAGNRFLFRRGWVIQEWLLSPRAIVFDRDELFWSCDHVEHCECQPAPRKAKRYVYESSPTSVRERFRRGHAQENPENTSWFAVIEVYSSASLTFECDRLPALSGLAKKFASTVWAAQFDEKFSNYLAGCWREHLLPSLLWYENRDIPERKSDSIRQFGYVAPSWSWAAAPHSVLFQLFADLKRTVYVTSVEHGYCTPATSDPTGAVESGYLIAYGPTFEIDLDLTITRSVKRPDVEEVGAETVVELDLHANTYFRLTETPQRSVRATFLLIGCCVDFSLMYHERGVIIVPSKEHSGSYERLGFFEARGRSDLWPGQPHDADGNLGHVDWQKYREAERKDEDEWRRRAYGVHTGDNQEHVNVDDFVKKLRNGDVDEMVKRNTLLPLCTLKRVTIV